MCLVQDKSVYLIDIRIRFPQYYVGIALKRRLIRIDIFVAYAEQREFELLCKLCLFLNSLLSANIEIFIYTPISKYIPPCSSW